MSSNPFEQPDFEGELPADFAALGQQLQADAQRLSSVYPACKAPQELPKALKETHVAMSRQWWMRRELSLFAASAAAVLFVVGLVAMTFSPWSEPVAQPADPLPVAERGASEADVVQPVAYQPVPELSGPALEGLLDLLQENPQAAATSISF
jgi:hypothetical protein